MVQLTDILVGVLLVSMVALGAGSFMYEQSQQHNTQGVDMGFNSTFDHLGEITNTTRTLQEKVETASLESAEGFAALFTGSFAILRIVSNVAFLPISIFTDLGDTLGLPWWFSTGITAILIIVIVFIIANIIFGRGRA